MRNEILKLLETDSRLTVKDIAAMSRGGSGYQGNGRREHHLWIPYYDRLG